MKLVRQIKIQVFVYVIVSDSLHTSSSINVYSRDVYIDL